jgi:hypothetical protein
MLPTFPIAGCVPHKKQSISFMKCYACNEFVYVYKYTIPVMYRDDHHIIIQGKVKRIFITITVHAILPALLAILGQLSAHSLATGPVIVLPFISPLTFTITPALSSK